MAGKADTMCFAEKLAILACIGSNSGQTVDRIVEELPFDGVPEKVEMLIDQGFVQTERKDPGALQLTDEGLYIVEGAAQGAGPVFRGEGRF